MSAPRADFLLELGVEELPTSYIAPALAQLERQLKEALAEARLAHGECVTFATPRRLAVLVRGLVARQDDYREEATGPPVAAAWDKDGQPTKALLGFARGKGVDVADVRRVKTDKGEYVAVTVERKGRAAGELLAAAIARIVPGLAFPKTMRWLDAGEEGADFRFARPLRWIVALLGSEVLDLTLAGLVAGRETRGHRFLHPGAVAIGQAGDYAAELAQAGVVVDAAARQHLIVEQATALARSAGGRLVADEELVVINNFLVEKPTALLGQFDASYLDLPREVIVMALREHQRYFAVEDASGALMPAFVGVRNGDDTNLAGVIAGNTAVLKARLDDARFYWDTDVARSPEARVPDLAGIVWLADMGSMLDKTHRVQKLAARVAGTFAADAATVAVVERAALLAKSDLMSEMIGSGKEYASLEGVIGAYYAARHGESAPVVEAIREHVRPKGAGDALPGSIAGAAVSVADRADTVVGCFLAGRIPTGSEDPYGVRRAANGVVRLALEQERALDLAVLTGDALAGYEAAGHAAPSPEVAAKLAEFWSGRVATALAERGAAYDEIAAALGGRETTTDPLEVERRARALARWRGNADFVPLVVGYKRVANILRAVAPGDVAAPSKAAYDDPAEAALAAALQAAVQAAEPAFKARDYDAVLRALLALRAPIDAFFDAVMVNVDDVAIRRRRLGLLASARGLFDRGWDLSKVVVEG